MTCAPPDFLMNVDFAVLQYSLGSDVEENQRIGHRSLKLLMTLARIPATSLLATKPDISIIMLTMLEDNDSRFAAMCAGARRYILKGADKAELLKTIQAVAERERCLVQPLPRA